MELNTTNFFKYFIIHPNSKNLNASDRPKALAASIGLGIITLGIAHIIAAIKLRLWKQLKPKNQPPFRDWILGKKAQPTAPLAQPASRIIQPPVAEPATSAQKFKWNTIEIRDNYKKLVEEGKIKVQRQEVGFDVVADKGGAVNVGYRVFEQDPSAKIGVMIAANSGLPGGALGRRPDAITAHDVQMSTQEEAVWADAVLTACGTAPAKQLAFHENTIKDKWGMIHQEGTSIETIQGIDFTTTTQATDYNLVFLVNGGKLAPLDEHKNIIAGKEYPVVFSFADSVNANPGIGSPTGTMQRTLNQKAINDYDFFRSCVKEKLRSSLDSMASEGVTHPLVALLSCGIYAGKHQKKIKKDFNNILNELLQEKVGPKSEPRGWFFKQVIIPTLA